VTDEESAIYEPGDVVYGNDPFKGGEAARPWLIISNHEHELLELVLHKLHSCGEHPFAG
jgi:hypothetical protein